MEKIPEKINKEKSKNKKTSRYFQPQDMQEEVYNINDKTLKKFKSAHWRKRQDGKTRKKNDEWPVKRLRNVDKFPGDAPVSKEKIKKYKRGSDMEATHARTNFHQSVFEQKEEKLQLAAKQAARSELLLQEHSGFIEAESDEETTYISQHDIVKAVDINSASKYFELTLKDFGPYKIHYTRNGRFLLMGGAKGHVAAIDWQTKKLLCEMNVMETVQDVKWLHQETMFAVAQKQWTYIYDNQGIELHCLKALDCVLNLEFLPYHFLLASSNRKGYLSWLDVSIGQKVAGHSTGMGRLDIMCQNPYNATICLGHSGGTVTMWSPNVKEPLIKMLCHGGGVRSVTVDKKGRYMCTSGIDRTMKIWDLRTYKMLQSYKIGMGASHLAFSQKNTLAVSKGNIVEIYKDCCQETITSPYLTQKLPSSVFGLQFCPFEDVLGVGHSNGFSSLIIPGSGEPNFDAMESNPYQTKKQRRQAEVKMLLDKVPYEMIHLDTGKIGQVDQKTMEDKIEESNKILFLKPKKIEYEPSYKMKGRSKGLKKEQRKKGVIEERKRDDIKEIMDLKQKEREKNKTSVSSNNVLDRFKKKE
ncbi:WD repeat-containing protein 46-like [Mytilus trossulus]|uniref:WD repeat-containing protein 46-like n=1 Tax=Mytilus trossulus TaxID=6551 RepID=UPI003004D249